MISTVFVHAFTTLQFGCFVLCSLRSLCSPLKSNETSGLTKHKAESSSAPSRMHSCSFEWPSQAHSFIHCCRLVLRRAQTIDHGSYHLSISASPAQCSAESATALHSAHKPTDTRTTSSDLHNDDDHHCRHHDGVATMHKCVEERRRGRGGHGKYFHPKRIVSHGLRTAGQHQQQPQQQRRSPPPSATQESSIWLECADCGGDRTPFALCATS